LENVNFQSTLLHITPRIKVASTYAFVAAPSVFVLQLRVSWRKKKKEKRNRCSINGLQKPSRDCIEQEK